MIANIQIFIGCIGLLLSLYVLMTKKINTKSCFDTLLISLIGIHWMVVIINTSMDISSYSNLVLHLFMLILYILVFYFRYKKGKENELCTTLGEV